MADDEQFSLCWNNFNTNLSAGFHESLCRGDLVDVTLAAEGQMVKAHRLVLSVCSPYFRKMFTQMPANQHAFVFLKDVSHSALKDLIQFMYCGEVNVKHDALPAFISTAEALQIKGLTETAEGNTTASPAKTPTPAPSASNTTSPRSRGQRNISRTSYKLESEDSNDERHIIVPTQKRAAQRSVTPQSAPAVKRIKSIDPLEAAEPIQETVTPDKSEEPEFIDLPIESLPTKSEPEYAEDSAEVESAEQDASYVEDDSYGDMKYDESYFTENEEGKPGVSGFSESYVTEGDQSATEAQEIKIPNIIKMGEETYQVYRPPKYFCYKGYAYKHEKSRGNRSYWHCYGNKKTCKARLVNVKEGSQEKITQFKNHNHSPTEPLENNEFEEELSNSTRPFQLLHKGQLFYRHYKKDETIYWRCHRINAAQRCPGRLCTGPEGIREISFHNHNDKYLVTVTDI